MKRQAYQPILITDAPRSQDDQLRGRQVRYVVMMAIRVLCVIAGAVLVGAEAPMLWLLAPALRRRDDPDSLACRAVGQRSTAQGAAPVAPAAPCGATATADADRRGASPPGDRRRTLTPRASGGKPPTVISGAVGRRPSRRRRRQGRRPGPNASTGSAPVAQAASSPAAKASPAPVTSCTGTWRAVATTISHWPGPRPPRAGPASPPRAGPTVASRRPASRGIRVLRQYRGLVRVGQEQVRAAYPVERTPPRRPAAAARPRPASTLVVRPWSRAAASAAQPAGPGPGVQQRVAGQVQVPGVGRRRPAPGPRHAGASRRLAPRSASMVAFAVGGPARSRCRSAARVACRTTHSRTPQPGRVRRAGPGPASSSPTAPTSVTGAPCRASQAAVLAACAAAGQADRGRGVRCPAASGPASTRDAHR